MDNKMKDRYDIVCGMISTSIVLAYIIITLGVIALIGSGIYYCVDVSMLPGIFMLLGGGITGIVGYIIIGCVKYINKFFCDIAETVLKGNRKNDSDEYSQVNKKGKTDVPKKQVLIYNKINNNYFSGINRQFGSFAIMTCDNPNGAMCFTDEYDAISFMKEFKLREKDGWAVKQIKL